MNSLSLKGEGSSCSESTQAQVAGTKLIQHCYNNVDIEAALCWLCFSSLFFLDSNYIHMFWVHRCMYHFSSFSFVEFSFICDACGIKLLFTRHFCSTLILLAIAWINNLKIIFNNNNYNVFAYTMITIPFGLALDFMVFAISLAMVSYITSKSLINKIWICIFHAIHFSSTTKFILQN